MLAAFHSGKFKHVGKRYVKVFCAAYLDGQVYDPDVMDVLWEAFRHKLAHLSYPQFVFDTALDGGFSGNHKYANMRITWLLDEKSRSDHLRILPDQGDSKGTTPYPVPYDHRIYISLADFRRDILNAINAYCVSLQSDSNLMTNFRKSSAQVFR
jgi:hypothetical protein